MILRSAALVGLATSGLLCASDEQPPPFTVQATNVSQTRYISFGVAGQVASNSQELQIGLTVQPVGTMIPVSVEPPQVTEAVTDSGERLALVRREHSEHQSTCNRDEAQGIQLSLQFTPPDAPARSVTISGTIMVAYGTGEVDTARLQPFERYIGKRVRFGDRAGMTAAIRQQDHDSLSLFLTRDTDRLLRRVVFVGADRIVNQPSDDGIEMVDETSVRHAFSGTFAPGGTLLLEFHRELKRAKVPFSLKDVALIIPQPQNQDTSERVELVIGTTASDLAVQVLDDLPAP
ncbi:MAG: hypothetical protein H0V44_13800 [Planctomycetes bacterium]|nr:hypothetical protein [Planctomycetota bacterium]